MKIQGCGKSFVNEVFAASEAKTQEEQLEKDRKDHGLTNTAGDSSMQTQLSNGHKQEELSGYEKILRKHEGMHAPNAKLEGTIEQRMNEASKDFYPHRNPDAYQRTGEKRPVNALPEELGNASDEAKRKRYEKANKPGKERILDKDVGSQKTAKVFNLHEDRKARLASSVEKPVEKPKQGIFNLREQRNAAKSVEYINYKNVIAGIEVGKTYDEVKNIDATMASIMETSSKSGMSEDAKAQIMALKVRKQELLRA